MPAFPGPPLERPPPRLTNLTIQVDHWVLSHAYWKALTEGTSVNGVLEDFLAEWTGVPLAIRRQRRVPRVRPMTIYREALRRERSHRPPKYRRHRRS